MIDMMQDPDLGEILRHVHSTAKPTALLCHGPVAIAAAMPKEHYAEEHLMVAAKFRFTSTTL
jgi:putative intracellular protease/amidase